MLHQSRELLYGTQYDSEICDAWQDDDLQRTLLRVLSYHAIDSDDRILFKWLLNVGLEIDELYWYIEDDEHGILEKSSILHGISSERYSPSLDEEPHVMLSLLAVAGGHNSLSWIDFLRTEGINMRDSMALL
jgi:ankyrin repeat protein